MRPKIEVRFEKTVAGFGAAGVRRAVRAVLKAEKAGDRSVGVLVTGDRQIRRINKRFLNHDWATDVISFGLGEKGMLGDVVVSVDTARRAARDLGLSLKEEISRYLIHGTLHLLGYDDKAPKARRKMFKRQEMILKGLK